MNDWIKKMNEMFEENAYTNAGRVTVYYCENAKCILVSVCNNTSIIKDIDRLNDFGLMMECIVAVKNLYQPYYKAVGRINTQLPILLQGEIQNVEGK